MLSKTIIVLTLLYVVKAGVLTLNEQNDNEAAENAIVHSPSRACTASICTQLCQQLGFQNGVCISPTVCRCSGRRTPMDSQQKTADNYDGKEFEIDLEKNSEVRQEFDNDYVATDPVLEPSVRSCTASICTQLCRQLGFQIGVCISPTVCWCSGRALSDNNGELKDNFERRDIEFDVVNDKPVLGDDNYDVGKIPDVGVDDAQLSTRACTASICTQLCRLFGFQNGVCVSPTVCRCSGRRALTDDSSTDI